MFLPARAELQHVLNVKILEIATMLVHGPFLGRKSKRVQICNRGREKAAITATAHDDDP